MSVEPNDQIAYDLSEAIRLTAKKYGAQSHVDVVLFEQLIGEVEARRSRSSDVNRTINEVLDGVDLDDLTTEIFRRGLKRVFGRRAAVRKAERIALESALDFPRGQEM